MSHVSPNVFPVTLFYVKYKFLQLIVSTERNAVSQVHNLSMYGQKYQWILPDWAQGNWWTITGLKNCTAINILTAMEGSISADFETLSSSHIRGISGRVCLH